MILVIDNYDSFVYNLARYFECEGESCKVMRNDVVNLDDIKTLNPRAIVISPGPCAPEDSGICLDLIRSYGASIPILGVCLGHQCIGEAYGGRIEKAREPMHGKAALLNHNNRGLFSGLPNPLSAGRYHSLIVTLPESSPLEVTAHSEKGEIMALQHREYPVFGVQFHPESVLTQNGTAMIRNFLALARRWRTHTKAAA